MKTLLFHAALACFLLAPAPALFGQLQDPVEPVNVVLDDDLSLSVDDVGNQAVLWALANRGEVNVLALICSSANDYSAPTMRAIANYYGHPNVPIGAHKGATPILENSANSSYTQQIANQFGTPGDTRANYPDAVTVYRQALAAAPDGSVYIVASGYYQPLQALLESQPDSISPFTGLQLVQQKVRRLVSEAGWFPSGNEHNFRVDADAAGFVFANWPGEIVSLGAQMTQDVFTGPSSIANAATDPVQSAWQLFNGGNTVPGFGQVALLYAVRGLGSNFVVSGFNGQTTIGDTTSICSGCDSWSPTPNMQQSYLNKQATAAQLEAILNPLVQSSSNLPIVRSIAPGNVPQGTAQTVTLTGTNFFTDSQVLFNGSSRPTTFTSGTQLSVQLSGSDLAQPGSDGLNIRNPENGGSQSATANLTVDSTDTIAPATSPSVSPSPNENGWNKTNVTLALNSTDNEPGGSGVKQITYSASGAQNIAGTIVAGASASIPIGAEGVTTVTFLATDNAGNVEAPKTIVIRIDKTPPALSGSANPNRLWPPNGKTVPVTISGTASDNGSSIDTATGAFAVTDSEGQVQPSGSVVLAPDGSFSFTVSLVASRQGNEKNGRQYTITVNAADRAGNPGSCSNVVTVPHDQGH
jgi:inosine-uridine nucleoside N-ribohydrolase